MVALSAYPSVTPAPVQSRHKAERAGGRAEMSFLKCDDFADRWAGWLRVNFQSQRQIAVAFSVDERTVRYWLAGTSEPRGRHLAHALRSYPQAIPQLVGQP